MPEVNQDVNTSDSSTEEQAVTKPVEETTVEQPATQEQETPEQPTAIPEAVTKEGEVDEMGVPYKNRFYEYKRKYSELESNLPNMIQQAVREAIPQQPISQQQPQYTEEQLIQLKETSQDPNARAWAELELRKIDSSKQEQKFRSILEEQQRNDRLVRDQNAAFDTVRRKYSAAFNTDGSPNMNHPLTQSTISIYRNDPVLQKDGLGLLKAADMAFANYALMQSPQLAQQQKQLKRQVKKLEKATLVEGSGQPVHSTGKTPLTNAKEQFMKTGKVSDLTSITKELLRGNGMIEE